MTVLETVVITVSLFPYTSVVIVTFRKQRAKEVNVLLSNRTPLYWET